MLFITGPVITGVSLKDYEWENSTTLFNNIMCNETHSMLLQCIDLDGIGVYNCSENNIARVGCEMPNPDVDVTTFSMLTETSVSTMS